MLTPSVIRLALTWGAVDHPNPRKIHQRLMPRMGGLAVFFAFCLPWAGLYLIDNPVSAAFRDFEKRFAVLVFGATTMLLLGIYDDLKGANAGKKLIVQVAAAFVLWAGGIRIEDLAIPWSDPIDLNWFSLPVTILWIVGVTNAINLLDGIDGLVTAAGESSREVLFQPVSPFGKQQQEDLQDLMVDDLAALSGRSLAQPLRAGKPVREAQLQQRRWFRVGQTVQVVAVGDGFSVSASGRALSDGVAGRPARVRTEAGRVLVGRPTAEGRLEIRL